MKPPKLRTNQHIIPIKGREHNGGGMMVENKGRLGDSNKVGVGYFGGTVKLDIVQYTGEGKFKFNRRDGYNNKTQQLPLPPPPLILSK